MTPEAIQADPDEVFTHFLNKVNKEIAEWNKKNEEIAAWNKGKQEEERLAPLQPISQEFTKEEFFYDIRTGKIIKCEQIDVAKQVVNLPEFCALIAQLKFFDGQTDGYTDPEIQKLTEWLTANDPAALRDHFLNEVLRVRYRDKQAFQNSQLGRLFADLLA